MFGKKVLQTQVWLFVEEEESCVEAGLQFIIRQQDSAIRMGWSLTEATSESMGWRRGLN